MKTLSLNQWGVRLSKVDLTPIVIDDPTTLNLRMAQGNEMGANEDWLAGGYLPTGKSEAVIDNVPATKFSEKKIK